MTNIARYHIADDRVFYNPSKSGRWCKWEDVEALQRELEDMRAKAIAAVWLMRDDVTMEQLGDLRAEAKAVFMGEDKKTIARLQDKVARLQHALHEAVRPESPGVTGVYGVKAGEERKLRYALMITELHHGPNGGLEIEVLLP